jgi:hypothetical protein
MEIIVALVILITSGAVLGSLLTSGFATAALFTTFFVLGGVFAIPTFIHWLASTYDREGRLPGTLCTIFCVCMCVLIVLL